MVSFSRDACVELGYAIADMLRAEQGGSARFRIGLVTAVDTDSVPWLAMVGGRWMPFINDAIAVGSFVYWANLPSPVAWGSQFDLGDPTAVQTAPNRGFVFSGPGGAVPGLVNPLDRVNETPLTWNGGIVFYSFSSPSLSLSSVNTNVSGAGLDTHPPLYLGLGWNGVPVTAALPTPVDEYTNLGGSLWLRSHGDVGINNMPGALPSPTPGEYSATSEMVVVRNAKSILDRAVASSTTTLTGGSPVAFPEIIATAPGQLAVFLTQPKFVSYGGVSTSSSFDAPEGAPDGAVLSRGGAAQGLSSRGHLAVDIITAWEAGPIQPTITLGSGSRQVALSSFLCEPADVV